MTEARFAVGDADADLAERLDKEISAFNVAASGDRRVHGQFSLRAHFQESGRPGQRGRPQQAGLVASGDHQERAPGEKPGDPAGQLGCPQHPAQAPGFPADAGSLLHGDARAEMALAEVERSLGYIVGKKAGLPDGSSIVFRLTGPLRRDLYVTVDGRAKVVSHIDRPDVELSTDSVTFVQLACGRIDPQAQIDAGRVRWTGDDELGSRAARNLRYTM